jgi:alkaline phosphatase
MIPGYVFDESRKRACLYPDGTKCAYSTITYANGKGGFYSHYTNNSARPWRDAREFNTKDINYTAPAMIPMAGETHSGEDVPFLASGPWTHLFTGVQEQSYFALAIEHAAGWGDGSADHLYSSSSVELSFTAIIIPTMILLLFSFIIE